MIEKEKQILNTALLLFHQNTGFELVSEASKENSLMVDCFLKFANNTGKKKLLATEIKPNLTKSILDYVIHQLELYQYKSKTNFPVLIVSEYISEPIAQELIKQNIFFLDCVGNAYLKNDTVFILISGKKKRKEKGYTKPKAFQATGIKLLFAFFIKEELLNYNYRELSTITGIATGSLSEIFKSLKENKFLIESEKEGKVLVNRKKLLEKFIIGYNEYLKPKLNSKKYRFLDDTMLKQWQVIDFHNKGFFWAGEPAAALQTNYLKPEKWSIYSTIERKELIKTLKIVPDEKGNLEIRNGFWTSELQEIFEQVTSVPPLLSYLDLILSEESRNIETAQVIYERYLSDFFEKY